MEALIRSHSFVHNDENAYTSFTKSFNELTADDDNEIIKMGEAEVLKSLDVLGGKLTADSKPEPETKGWEMALYTFKQLLDIACQFVRKNPSKELEKGFYLFIVHLLDNSLVILHLTIAHTCLYERDIHLKEYIQAMDKGGQAALLKVVCKPIKADEANKGKDFGLIYYKLIKLLVNEIMTAIQVKESFSLLLDYTVYCYLDTTEMNENVYKQLVYTGQEVMSRLDNPFSTFDDIEKIKLYIRKCANLFQSKTFAPNHTVSRYTLEFMERKMMKELGKKGRFEELYNEIFDLLMAISKCTYTLEGDKYLLDLFYGAQVYVSNFDPKSPSTPVGVFEAIVQRFIKVVEEMDMKFLNHYRFAYSVVDSVLKKLYANDKPKSRLWVSMLIPLLKKPCESTIRASYTITSENKAIKWKEHSDIINQVLENLLAYQIPPSVKGIEKTQKEEIKNYLDYFKRMSEYFFDGLKKDKLTKAYGKVMMDLSLKFMNTDHEELLNLAESIAEKTELNIKEDKAAMLEAMKKFHELIQDESKPWSTYWPLYRAANDFIDKATEPFKDGKVFASEEFEVFIAICLTCLKYDCINPETGSFPSGYFSMFLSTVRPLFKWLEALNKMEVAAPLVPELIKCLDVDDENVVTLAGVYLMSIGRVSSGKQVAAPYLDKLITTYLAKENQNLIHAILEIYPSNPKALKSHYRDLIQLMEDTGEPSLISYLAQLFQHVSKKQADLFTKEDIEMLFKKAQEYENSQVLIIQILQELSKRCPDKMIDHLHLLFDKSAWSPHVNYFLNDMMVTLALYKKEVASTVLAEIFKDTKTNQEKTSLLMSFNALRMIGFKYPELMKERRKEVETFSSADPDIINMQKLIIDMIDGKTPEDMINQLKKQEEDLANLVGRVDETEELLIEVKGEVTKQGEQLDNVKNEVQEQGMKLENVENKVDETIVKVEEIDKKTLSHAPFWARDISKLLNPKSDHDWRLLSSRLGYKNEDIRGWAQQADPCMAMLNEWYVTHKTSEATLAVLTQLQEMDRLDGAAIVENAMKNAEAVVEDEEFVYASPPPIFISYQWSHQAEVKLLKQHLEMAGYECWLDIGQMGGGDKLFEKIDTGIRAAKVVISCVTSKYAKSPNCNREVNLAVSLNKPIIPLLLEQCPWPPPGSMGPIFSEYLFIRFFQRTGEEMPDQRYWAKDKFQELLMQLNVVGLSPEEVKVQSEYKNWWIPVIQEIKIDKSKTKNGGAVSDVVQSDLDKIASESPDIFISYQWGKQKNILKLYERLSSLGFSCWLDIKQMGGGDSLYDKIDKGIRGCKVVLSCVTQKYSLSANCRREVSLTDALKKPMIPLLLEKMNWPPSGPMSMVMTQLVYINFFKDESIQMIWDGPEFEELLHQIRQHVPSKHLASDNVSQKYTAGNETNNMKSADNALTKPSVVPTTSAVLTATVPKDTDVSTAAFPKTTVVPTTRTTVSNPVSPTLKPQRKISQPTKPSLAPIKQHPKSNQKLRSPIVSPPSTASSQSKKGPIKQMQVRKKSPLLMHTTTSKPLTSTTSQKVAQSNAPKNNPIDIAPSSKQILKPISSELKTALKSTNQISASQPTTTTQQPRSTVQKTPGRPSRLPPLEQRKEGEIPVKKDDK